jgi:hypothetical protein
MSTASNNRNCSTMFSVNSFACVGVSFIKSQMWECNDPGGKLCSGKICKRHSDMGISFTFQCLDGVWYYNNGCTPATSPNCY